MPFRSIPPYDKAFQVTACEGEVVVMGNRTSEALTPEAALESAERLVKAARRAIRQRDGPGRRAGDG